MFLSEVQRAVYGVLMAVGALGEEPAARVAESALATEDDPVIVRRAFGALERMKGCRAPSAGASMLAAVRRLRTPQRAAPQAPRRAAATAPRGGCETAPRRQLRGR